PEWASEITGIPVAIIKSFAKRLINEKPAMIIQGWGPQRHYLGGNNCRAISLMAILTKNIGIQGGGSGARESGASVSLSFRAWSTTFPSNPVTYTVSHYTWYQAILDHTSMTRRTWGVKGLATPDTPLPLPIKFIWNYAGNCMTNQHGDINETMKMYKDESKCECIVTIENSFTPSALVSDYILPDCTNWEQNDVTTNSGGNSAIMVFDTKAVEPLFECKTIYEMLTLIADKIGIKQQFTEDRTQDEWLEFLFNETLRVSGDQGVFTAENGLDTYAKAKAAGLVRKVVPTATPTVAYKAFVDDPITNKVSTPSGKFEIFSKRLYNLSHQWVLPGDGLDRICAIPEFHATQDGYTHSKRDEYPFQVVGHHYKQRTHSTYYNTSWNREANPQTAWINSGDAANLGIRHGDTVEIWNDRGKVRVKAKVTPRIMPGVIALPQGAWYNPGGKWFNSKIEHTGSITAAEVGNTSVVDHGGCNNVLTSLRPEAYSKGNCQHSVLANVRKVG
ncbi:MAG: molybdopterin-dependent oxidoreductase, partial [Geovibrio sp.]|nr:molybdopterin-dependent oxidoreductase [Geovibrio sp.]